ncbi:uncharacterized protein METZ01_LOCUS303828, partial [marine metagenome]
TNDAPTISSTAILTGTEDVAYSYTVTAADVDPTGTTTLCDITNTGSSETCTFTLPAGEILDLSWSHDYYGTEFSMDVTKPDATIDSYGPYGYGSGSYSTTYTDAGSYTVVISDVYSDGGGAAVASYEFGDSYTLAGTTIPAWMSFDAATGILSGTPDDSGVWDNIIVITATDEAGATATDSFTLNITNVNDAPGGSSVLIGDGSPWTQASSDTLTNYGVASSTYTLTITSLQRATITMTNTDNYASECGLEIDGTDVGCGYASSYQYGGQTGSPYSITTAGTYSVVVTDSYGDGGNYATIVIEDGNAATTIIQVIGFVYDGEVLTADSSLLTDDDGVGALNYQWANQDGDIAGATSSTYTIGACCDVLGDTYSVTVSYT